MQYLKYKRLMRNAKIKIYYNLFGMVTKTHYPKKVTKGDYTFLNFVDIIVMISRQNLQRLYENPVE